MGIAIPLPVALFDTLGYLALEPYAIYSSHINQKDFQKARTFILSYRGSLDTFKW